MHSALLHISSGIIVGGGKKMSRFLSLQSKYKPKPRNATSISETNGSGTASLQFYLLHFQCGENYIVNRTRTTLHYLGFCLLVDHSKSSENERQGIIYEMIKCRYYIQGGKKSRWIYLGKVRQRVTQIFRGFFPSSNKLIC